MEGFIPIAELSHHTAFFISYSKERIKVTKVKRNKVQLDDFDLAAQEIFDHVENAEKTVLNAAEDFIKNEAEFFSIFVSTGHKDAAKDLFDHIESIEHKALFAVGDFGKNEVDFFFPNHEMGQSDEEIHQYGGQRGSDLRKKRNMEKFDMESKHDRMVHIINEYIETDLE